MHMTVTLVKSLRGCRRRPGSDVELSFHYDCSREDVEGSTCGKYSELTIKIRRFAGTGMSDYTNDCPSHSPVNSLVRNTPTRKDIGSLYKNHDAEILNKGFEYVGSADQLKWVSRHVVQLILIVCPTPLASGFFSEHDTSRSDGFNLLFILHFGL